MWVLTQFWFHKSICYPKVIGSHCLPIHYSEDGELRSQGVHHEGQVSLTYLKLTTGLAWDGTHQKQEYAAVEVTYSQGTEKWTHHSCLSQQVCRNNYQLDVCLEKHI